MEIRIKITVEDYRDYLRALKNFLRSGNYDRRASLRNTLFNVVLGISTGVGVSLVFMTLGHRIDTLSMLAGMLMIFAIFVFYMKRNQAKLLPKHEGILLGDHVFTFTDTGFSDKTSLFETSLRWDAAVAMQETDRHFFIFLDTCQAYFIPKRDLGSEDTVLQLRNLLQEKNKQLKGSE